MVTTTALQFIDIISIGVVNRSQSMQVIAESGSILKHTKTVTAERFRDVCHASVPWVSPGQLTKQVLCVCGYMHYQGYDDMPILRYGQV